MKNLKNIIRKNLNLLNEDWMNYKTEYLPNDTNVATAAKHIYHAFSGGGTDVKKLKLGLSYIKNANDFIEADKIFKTFGLYNSIADGMNSELEMSGTGGWADNLDDFLDIAYTLGEKGVSVQGGWSGGKQIPIQIIAKAQTQSADTKKVEDKKDETKNNDKTTTKTKPSSSSSVTPKSYNNNTKDIQTLISKTKYKDILPTKKTPSGIDGYWGHRTSQALMSLLNDYQTKIQGGNSNNIKVKGELDQEF